MGEKNNLKRIGEGATSYWHLLPYDIIYVILSLSDPTSFCHFTRTCKRVDYVKKTRFTKLHCLLRHPFTFQSTFSQGPIGLKSTTQWPVWMEGDIDLSTQTWCNNALLIIHPLHKKNYYLIWDQSNLTITDFFGIYNPKTKDAIIFFRVGAKAIFKGGELIDVTLDIDS